MKTTVISSQRQITIPSEYLKKIGATPKSKVDLEVVGKTIVIKPRKKSVVEELAGSIKVSEELMNVPWEEVWRRTVEIVAKEIAEEGIENNE